MANKERHPVRLPPKVAGTLLRVLQFLVVSIGFFAWWVAMFLLVDEDENPIAIYDDPNGGDIWTDP